MREKVVESLELLKELFSDVDSLDKQSMKRVNKAVQIIEGNLDNDTYTRVATEEKKVVVEKVLSTINELKEELREFRSKGLVYQATEGAELIKMLEEQIESLTNYANTIEEGTEEMLSEPFSGIFEQAKLEKAILSELMNDETASYFFKNVNGTLELDYEKIETLYDLIMQDEDLLKRVGELMPILVKKVKADNKVCLAEADLHLATLANDKYKLFVDYFAKERVVSKESADLFEKNREYEEAKTELDEILREGNLFQILCKKIIDEKKENVAALRMRKVVSEDIISTLQVDITSLGMEIENLGLYPVLNRLKQDFGSASIISIPRFLRVSEPLISLENEKEALQGITTLLVKNLDVKQSKYDEAEVEYKEAYDAFSAAMEESSKEVKDFLNGDLETIVRLHSFLSSDAKNNYRVFMSLFIVKLLRDVKELSYEDKCEIFSNELELKEKRDEYKKIVEPINRMRYNGLCDSQDEFTRRFIGGDVHLKK